MLKSVRNPKSEISRQGDTLAVTVDFLIKDELAGKTSAIARYDEIVWRVRTGYAVLLYGAVGLITSFVNSNKLQLSEPIVLALATIFLGFSLFGGLIDYSFVTDKLRVVDYRDKLVRLAYLRAAGEDVRADDLMDCLKNSGERKEPIDWSKHVGRRACSLYYIGTGVICTLAIALLLPR